MNSARAVGLIVEELERASKLNGPFNSAHEGCAVIREEFEELWDEVKLKATHRSEEALIHEATQVAAMALRFLIDLTERDEPR